ncbi:hypothetical protein P170DRAFT_386308 [Aspergillus steynii IBT 23096]|uniref:ASST-domain-containing protein n=1 Tax=Aspergillus steynii IBT 23096 TaxID=1392250 RepID=A0A2I2G5D0_9EURO|nr:uncharacterized protein P170DRAFT_386308 [Aspergillus steynii IBT 23096]PLB48081.1 hypothetical protein P170DRAFT_386308 [Aspergillus steynii IBT 23096]
MLSLGALAADNWPYQTFTTAPWRVPQLNINETGDVGQGYIFLALQGEQASSVGPTIYDGNGDLVYQGSHANARGFRVQNVAGQDMITFWSGQYVDPGYGYGTVHVLDNAYNELYTITLKDNYITPDGQTKLSYLDAHEHHVTARDTILVPVINVTEHDLSAVGGQPGHYVAGCLFYEIEVKSNDILYSWNALDHIPIELSEVDLTGTGTRELPFDPYQLNAIAPTAHGFLVSLRGFSSVFYLNRDGSVRWQLSGINGGDFELDEVSFSWQHNTRVYDETDESLTLSLLSNANNDHESNGESIAMILHVDLINRKVSTIREVSDPNDPIHSKNGGSLQLLDPATSQSRLFVGYGDVPELKEYGSDGKVVFSVQFGHPGHIGSSSASKSRWRATPFWKPTGVAKKISDFASDVYMSWNGATEYDNWAIYSVPSQDSDETTFLTSQRRDGFETRISIRVTDFSYIRVAARQGQVSLGISDAIEL